MTTLAFQPVTSIQAGELLEAVRRYYAEDGISFDAARVKPAMAQLLADPALGQAFFLSDAATGARVGYVVWGFGFDYEFGGRLATVTDLFIEPAFRRRGLARAALAFAAETCRALGVGTLELHVENHNVAGRALYESSGFRALDRTPMLRRL